MQWRPVIVFCSAFFLISIALIAASPLTLNTTNYTLFSSDKNSTHHDDNPIDPSHLNSTEYLAWCHDVSGNNIYNLGSKLNCQGISLLNKIFTISQQTIVKHFQ